MPRAKNYRILQFNDNDMYSNVEAGPFYTEKAAAAHVRNNLPQGNYQIVRLYSTETSSDSSAATINQAVNISAGAAIESPLPEGFISEAVAEDSKVSQENFEAPALEFIDTDEIF